MQRNGHDGRALVQPLARRRRDEELLDVSWHIWLSLQHQRRLAQCPLVRPQRSRPRERQRLTTATSRSRRSALPAHLVLISEDLCFLPARFTYNAESSLLNTSSTDRTDLWVCKSKGCIENNTCEA